LKNKFFFDIIIGILSIKNSDNKEDKIFIGGINMNKFTTGLITGSILGVCGIAFAMSDKRSRQKLARDGRKIAKKAGDMANTVNNMF